MFGLSSRLGGLLCGLGVLVLGSLGARPATAQRIAVIGDYGYAGPAERDVANLVKSWDPELILTVGDNNYDLGDSLTIDQNIGQYYHQYIGNYRGRYGPSASTNRFFPTLGNHDYYTRNGEAYRYYFTLPGNGRYYEFVRGNVHFFALNSDPQEPDGISRTSVQAEWLKQRLAAAPEPWKVVYFHHAPYSSGWHRSTAVMQWPFKEWGASVVLAGHDHHYERLLVDGLPYFVNGLGGRSLYSTLNPLPQSQFRFSGDYGAMLLNANADSLTFQFCTRNRVPLDRYTLRRGGFAEPTLSPVFPNPLPQGAATVEFFLPSAAGVELRVLNALGQEVQQLYSGPKPEGWNRVGWSRSALSAGVYFVQLRSSGFTRVQQVVLL